MLGGPRARAARPVERARCGRAHSGMSNPTATGTVGVLLAAGRGKRMGRLKQLLPWPPGASADGRTVVAASFDTIAPHCDEMIVVVGAEAEAVASALVPRRLRMVQADPDAEMFQS